MASSSQGRLTGDRDASVIVASVIVAEVPAKPSPCRSGPGCSAHSAAPLQCLPDSPETPRRRVEVPGTLLYPCQSPAMSVGAKPWQDAGMPRRRPDLCHLAAASIPADGRQGQSNAGHPKRGHHACSRRHRTVPPQASPTPGQRSGGRRRPFRGTSGAKTAPALIGFLLQEERKGNARQSAWTTCVPISGTKSDSSQACSAFLDITREDCHSDFYVLLISPV